MERKLKKGDVLTCVDTDNYDQLTEGWEYMVLSVSENPSRVVVLNNEGCRFAYPMSCFSPKTAKPDDLALRKWCIEQAGADPEKAQRVYDWVISK
jgi:hypothetical protein